MKPHLCVIVTSDPRTSDRPAEAIRIAAGIGTWKKTEVSLYLRGPAILGLGEYVDDLKEEDNFTRYLPILHDLGRSIHVQKGAPEILELGESPVAFGELDDDQLAHHISQATYVMRF